MPQSAYDIAAPNGSSRRHLVDRATLIFRLYRVSLPVELPAITDDSILGQVQSGIRTARNVLRTAQAFMGDRFGPLVGRVLEREFRFVLLLEGLEFEPEVRTHFSYARKGFYVDTPFNNAKGVTNIRIRGMTHWTPVNVQGVPVDGDASLKDFQELIQDYFFPLSGRPAANYELYLYNTLAPVSAEDPFGEFRWLVHPIRNGVRVQQDQKRPYLRRFNFDCVGLRSNRDESKAEDGFLSSLFSKGLLRGLLDALDLGAVADAIVGVFGVIDEFKGLIDDATNVVKAAVDYVRGVSEFIVESIGKVRSVITGVEALIGSINNGIDIARSTPDVASAQWRLLQQTWSGLASTEIGGTVEDRVEVGVLAAAEVQRLQDVMLALAAQPQAFAPLAGSAQTATATVAVRIEPDTTIEDLALAAGTDVDTIIATNGLSWPFIDARPRPERQVAAYQAEAGRLTAAYEAALGESAPAEALTRLQRQRAEAAAELARWTAEPPSEPNVLYAGDAVRLPQASKQTQLSIVGSKDNLIAASSLASTEEERLFGRDLLVNDNGDLEWSDAAGELVTVAGIENIQAAQVRYVKLPHGALRFAPGIGNYAYEDLAKWQGDATNRMLAFDLYTTLLQDPRISKVLNVRATTYAGVAHLTYRAKLINGQTVADLRAPLGV